MLMSMSSPSTLQRWLRRAPAKAKSKSASVRLLEACRLVQRSVLGSMGLRVRVQHRREAVG